MGDTFAESTQRSAVAHDIRVLGDFTRIYCDAHHRDRERDRAETAAAATGLYGRRTPVLCGECEAHLGYAERRRAYCPKDPKPFCAHCDTHCYRPEESAWQREMMRYSGPRSWMHGHAIDGVRHLLETWRYRAPAAPSGAATDPTEEES